MYRSLLLCCLFQSFLLGCTAIRPVQNPNVLFIAIDDLNDWLGCMEGHPNAKSPNIDRLASRGTLFMNAHCQAPLCGPSRASLMSGLRPSSTGIYGQINDGDLRLSHPLLTNIRFLPQHFEDHGYKTMGVGKLFHGHAPEGVFQISKGREKGFGPKPPQRLKWDSQGTSTDWGAFPDTDEQMPDYRSAKWAIEQLAQDHEDPFFLAVGFLRPHVPWHVPKKWFDLHPIDSIRTPPYLKDDRRDLPPISAQVASVPMMPTTEWAIENEEWKAIVQAYLASISFVDHYVGEILNALERSEYADNTLIVLWSDHGYHLGEKNRFAKHSLWNEATQVPLIIAGPGLPQNQKTNVPVELLDLYPTISDLCGVPINLLNEGKSLKELIRNPTSDWPKAAITTYGKNNHSLRDTAYTYIQYEDGSEEFYDRRKDANEWDNLAGTIPVPDGLKAKIPTQNAPWSPESRYRNYPYFEAQRAKDVQED